MAKKYERTVADEIDWKIIDQLHAATVNFSTTSLELKKIFFVLVGILVPVLIKLAGNKLDTSLFVTLYTIITAFAFLDSFTYFYQEKLREKMNIHFGLIKSRNAENSAAADSDQGSFTIESNRTGKGRLRRSILNESMMLYWAMIILNTLALLLFHNNTI